MRLLGHKCSHAIILNHSHKRGQTHIYTKLCHIRHTHSSSDSLTHDHTHSHRHAKFRSQFRLTQAPGPIQVIPTVLPSTALLCWGLLLNCHVGSPRPKTTLLLTLRKRIHPHIHVNLTRFEFRSGMLPSARNTYQTISS